MFSSGDWYIFAPTCIPALTPSAGIHVPAETQIIWNWNTVPNATGYKWNTANNYAGATDMGGVTTKTETGLTCNTACTRYVWAYNTCGNSTQVTLTQTTSACAVAPLRGNTYGILWRPNIQYRSNRLTVLVQRKPEYWYENRWHCRSNK